MKKIKLAMALTAVMVASSVNATNQISTSVDVSAFVASGLDATLSSMEFGAVVAPLNVDSPSWVELSCSGNVSYSTNGSPNGDVTNTNTSGEQNEFGEDVTPEVGSISITGEPNYAISVSYAAGITPVGVLFAPDVRVTSDCQTQAINIASTALDGEGELDLSLFGRLSVEAGFSPSDQASKLISTSVAVTISYR